MIRPRFLFFAPLMFLAFLAFLGLGGLVVQALWNWLAPVIFGLPTLTFWQAFGLLALCRILFGRMGVRGGRGWHHRGCSRDGWTDRMADRMSRMSPDDRARLRDRLRERYGIDFDGPSHPAP